MEYDEAYLVSKNGSKLLEDVENALFTGHSRLFDIYRSLDKDGDGYISYKDFETALRNDYKIVASSNDLMKIARSIDTNNNGFLDFNEFQSVFSHDMSNRIKKELAHEVSAEPNKESLARGRDTMGTTLNAFRQI